jgi:hypothetical protein
VTFVVVTDGEENASQKDSREEIFAKVTEQTAKYGWEFMFLAANQDAIQEGSKYGVPTASSSNFSNQSTNSAFRGVATASVGLYAGGAIRLPTCLTIRPDWGAPRSV